MFQCISKKLEVQSRSCTNNSKQLMFFKAVNSSSKYEQHNNILWNNNSFMELNTFSLCPKENSILKTVLLREPTKETDVKSGRLWKSGKTYVLVTVLGYYFYNSCFMQYILGNNVFSTTN